MLTLTNVDDTFHVITLRPQLMLCPSLTRIPVIGWHWIEQGEGVQLVDRLLKVMIC